LAPDPERFLRRAVGDRKQHSLFTGLMRIALPGRHHEDLVDTPREVLAVDRGGALAFGDAEHGAVGRAVGLAFEALRQQREIGAHGRQPRPAVDRVGVTYAGAVALVDVAGLFQSLKDWPHL